MTINIQPVNDEPRIRHVNASQSCANFTEGPKPGAGPVIVIPSNATAIYDPEFDGISMILVTVSRNHHKNDVLSFTSPFIYSGTASLMYNGTAGQLMAVFDPPRSIPGVEHDFGVLFDNEDRGLNTGNRVLDVVVYDSHNASSNAVQFNVCITGFNDPPQIFAVSEIMISNWDSFSLPFSSMTSFTGCTLSFV